VSISSRGTRKGLAATSADGVIDWMNGQGDIERNPAFCYPGSHMGPDCIFLLRLSSGRFIWVFMQVKMCSGSGRIPLADLMDATRSVTPTRAWMVESVSVS